MKGREEVNRQPMQSQAAQHSQSMRTIQLGDALSPSRRYGAGEKHC